MYDWIYNYLVPAPHKILVSSSSDKPRSRLKCKYIKHIWIVIQKYTSTAIKNNFMRRCQTWMERLQGEA
jgi:hypothetical protein